MEGRLARGQGIEIRASLNVPTSQLRFTPQWEGWNASIVGQWLNVSGIHLRRGKIQSETLMVSSSRRGPAGRSGHIYRNAFPASHLTV
jgi:hypothetical protein